MIATTLRQAITTLIPTELFEWLAGLFVFLGFAGSLAKPWNRQENFETQL